MTSHELQTPDSFSQENVPSPFRLLVVSQIVDCLSSVTEQIFPDAIRLEKTPASKDDILPNIVAAHFHIPSCNMHITDLSGIKACQQNHLIMSSDCDGVLILQDAAKKGSDQACQVYAPALFTGFSHIVLALDNMSAVRYSNNRYDEICEHFSNSQENLDTSQSFTITPVDLALGDGVQTFSPRLGWYNGQPLTQLLANLSKQTGQDPSSKDTHLSDHLAVYLLWLDDTPLRPGRHYLFNNGKEQCKAHVSNLKYQLNPSTLEQQPSAHLAADRLGYANISLETNISFTPCAKNRNSSRFHLLARETGKLVAYGIIKHGLHRAKNISWQKLELDKETRAANKNQMPCVLWFTGLSGAGKSSVASLLEKKLHALGKHTYVLDGDNVRHGLCRDLGFTQEDRIENQRRISETAKLFVDAGLIVLVSFISPFRAERDAARTMFKTEEFIEIHMSTPLKVCEQRDQKGLYKKARAGQLVNFTGFDSPYEPPESAEITLDGTKMSPNELADIVLADLELRGVLTT